MESARAVARASRPSTPAWAASIASPVRRTAPSSVRWSTLGRRRRWCTPRRRALSTALAASPMRARACPGPSGPPRKRSARLGPGTTSVTTKPWPSWLPTRSTRASRESSMSAARRAASSASSRRGPSTITARTSRCRMSSSPSQRLVCSTSVGISVMRWYRWAIVVPAVRTVEVPCVTAAPLSPSSVPLILPHMVRIDAPPGMRARAGRRRRVSGAAIPPTRARRESSSLTRSRRRSTR